MVPAPKLPLKRILQRELDKSRRALGAGDHAEIARAFQRVVSVTRTSMTGALASANPVLFTTTEYLPGGSSVTRNAPSAPVVMRRLSCSVAVSMICISAPVTAPPPISTTLSLIAPVAPPCAKAADENRRETTDRMMPFISDPRECAI